MEYRNPVYNQYGTIDCEINHPDYGWIPFTAAPDDPEELGRTIHAEITAAGGIVDYVAPPPPLVTVITKFKLKKELVKRSLWQTFKDALNADLEAKEDFELVQELDIDDPTVNAFATALGYDRTWLEQLFRDAEAGT